VPILRSLVLVVALTFAELYVTVHAVPDAIGALPTIALLVASSLLGTWLLKREGRAVWRRFTASIGERRVPNRELVDGVLVIFGGALLIMPGFVTDAIGLILLLPPTRPLVRGIADRWVRRSLVARAAGAAARSRSRARASEFDVEGSATEYHDDAPVGPRPERQLRR
jgi:UPF0716 protein FxsA